MAITLALFAPFTVCGRLYLPHTRQRAKISIASRLHLPDDLSVALYQLV
jgi:hypothetical protein